jgi:hypothetical protein
MFSIFKKKSKNNQLKENFDKLYSFTDEQKKAILVSLFEIANSDEDFHFKETEYLKKTSEFLGISFRNSRLKKLLNNHKDELFGKLGEMSENQKDWYVFTVLGMVYADGKVMIDEFKHVEKFLLNLGFSQERIDRNKVKEQHLS